MRIDAHVEHGRGLAWPGVKETPERSTPWRRWATLRGALDATLLTAAVTVASKMMEPASDVWAIASLLLMLAGYAVSGLYRPRLRLTLAAELRGVLAVNSITILALAAAGIAISGGDGIGDFAVVHWLLASVAVTAGRAGLFGLERAAIRHAEASRRTLIIGAGRVGHLLAKRLQEDPRLGLTPVGFLDKEPVGEEQIPRSLTTRRLHVLGASWDLERVVAEHDVEQVIVAFSTAPHHVLLDLVRRCWALDVGVMVVPRLYEVDGRRTHVEHLGALPLVSVHSSDPRGWQFACKYALDRIVAALALLAMLPILAVIALAVLVTMGRPVLFRQGRVGRDGHAFEMLKFRTMRGTPDAVGEADSHWAALVLAGTGIDPEEIVAAPRTEDRRTLVGTILRRLSLDELPQLWNVVRGDMSLIGPRPERTAYVAQFEQAVYRYPDRHRVKSGLTGWAQVHGLRGETSLEDRIEWDNFYIENWTPLLDVKIVLKTMLVLLRRNGA